MLLPAPGVFKGLKPDRSTSPMDGELSNSQNITRYMYSFLKLF